MGKCLFIIGLALATLFPLVAAVGFGAFSVMECTGGGSSGSVDGCHLFEMHFNFPANLATPAFVASFISVPIGVLLALVGLWLMVTQEWRSRPKHREHGIYGPSGTLLTLSEASAAIASFDVSDCDRLLRSFGQPAHLAGESLEQLRERCIEILKSTRAYAA